jgi:hypothetical protein
MQGYNLLINGVLRIAHPGLYKAGLDVQRAMQSMPDIAEASQHWNSVFTAIGVVANRQSPLHRDTGTRAAWYDILTTIGGDAESVMDWPSLGLRLQYQSGTTLVFSGYTLAHQVPLSREDRFCIAYYMKENVHERFGVEAVGWMKTDYYNHRQ